MSFLFLIEKFIRQKLVGKCVLVLVALGLAACNGDDPIPEGEPTVRSGRFDISVDHSVALTTGEKAVWRAAVTKHYVRPKVKEPPASVSWIRLLTSCSFRGPSAGSKLTFVTAGGSYSKTPAYTIYASSLPERAQDYVSRWRAQGGRPLHISGKGEDNFTDKNVYITDLSVPYYLVLHSDSKTLWNLVVAEGVKIDGVLLLAPRGAGIANVPAGVNVAAFGQPMMRNCRINPLRPVHPDSGTARRAAEGDYLAQEAVANRRKTHNLFARWFRSEFGVLVSEVTIGGERVKEVLIGPVPTTSDARIPFRGIKAAALQLTQADYFVYGSEYHYRQKNSELVIPIAQKLAGGDLNSLNRR